MNFYIADYHFRHKNIINFDGRPYPNIEIMESILINNWNLKVQKKDTVYIVGDFCMSNEPKDWRHILSQLTGHKVLIRGNHDKIADKVKDCFSEICDYKEVKDSGHRVILSHYPMLLHRAAYNPDVIMICGHVHNTRENDFLEKWKKELKESRQENGDACGNIINVGCMLDYMQYTPQSLEELL